LYVVTCSTATVVASFLRSPTGGATFTWVISFIARVKGHLTKCASVEWSAKACDIAKSVNTCGTIGTFVEVGGQALIDLDATIPASPARGTDTPVNRNTCQQ